jgi:hypothetical protein
LDKSRNIPTFAVRTEQLFVNGSVTAGTTVFNDLQLWYLAPAPPDELDDKPLGASF